MDFETDLTRVVKATNAAIFSGESVTDERSTRHRHRVTNLYPRPCQLSVEEHGSQTSEHEESLKTISIVKCSSSMTHPCDSMILLG